MKYKLEMYNYELLKENAKYKFKDKEHTQKYTEYLDLPFAVRY